MSEIMNKQKQNIKQGVIFIFITLPIVYLKIQLICKYLSLDIQ